jgi:hypothetical protein
MEKKMKVLGKDGSIVKDVKYTYTYPGYFNVYEKIGNQNFINLEQHRNYESAIKDRNSRLFVSIK